MSVPVASSMSIASEHSSKKLFKRRSFKELLNVPSSIYLFRQVITWEQMCVVTSNVTKIIIAAGLYWQLTASKLLKGSTYIYFFTQSLAMNNMLQQKSLIHVLICLKKLYPIIYTGTFRVGNQILSLLLYDVQILVVSRLFKKSMVLRVVSRFRLQSMGFCHQQECLIFHPKNSF